jgi:hypothetical protein
MKLEEFDLSGYQEGTPPSRGLIDGVAIDREVSESIPCPECGGKCEYHPFVAEGSYRAFSVCTACGEAYEF